MVVISLRQRWQQWWWWWWWWSYGCDKHNTSI